MIGKSPKDDHYELFRTRLADLINPKHDFVLLANNIDWTYFENEFKHLYSDKPSRRAMPIRLMIGVLILKHLCNLGDEKIPSAWESNPYFQYTVVEYYLSINFPVIPAILFIFATE